MLVGISEAICLLFFNFSLILLVEFWIGPEPEDRGPSWALGPRVTLLTGRATEDKLNIDIF